MPKELLVTTPDQLAICCRAVAASEVFGFDTEFIGERTFVPDLCLVQVATPFALFLIDPFTTGPLSEFWNLVADPARTVIVHAGREEVRLCQAGAGRPPANLFDLQLAAGMVGLGHPLGYGPLIQQLLGARLNKHETLTDWKRRPLTEEQQRYAFDDVRYLIPLWEKLSERIARLNRGEWLRQENEAHVRRCLGAEPGVERWRKLGGLGSLGRRQLAVARALFAWRDEAAARVNRPVRTVLRDDLIAEIAKRNPEKVRDLQIVRGIPKRDLEQILEVVEQSRTLPQSEWPEATARDDDPPQVALAVGLLASVLGDLCARRELTPSLVATASDLKQLVRSVMRNDPLPDVPLAAGWRAEAVLGDLMAVLNGQRAVRVGSLRAAAPFRYESAPSSDPDGGVH